jgi:PEP-CTERM motif-containing protein
MGKQNIAKTVLAMIVLAVATSASALADDFVWGNNAAAGNPFLTEINMTTGTVAQNFDSPNLIAQAGNGRGIAVNGTTIYYSISNSGDIFVTDSVTHADGGVLFVAKDGTGTPLNGIATITWDGAHLWASGYNGTNNVYEYDLSGHLINTVLGFGNSRDGLEVTGTGIIANRTDGGGPYDLYNLSGGLVTSDFIDPTKVAGFTGITTGVTFDGTHYFISNPSSFGDGPNNIYEFDSSGTFIKKVALPMPGPDSGGWLLEDLASLGNTPTNPPPGVPEPSSLLLLGTGLLGLGGMLKCKFFS